MTPEDEERIARAVREAEAGTSAEFVCVMARTSSAYEYVPLVWAALVALATPWFMIELTLWSVERIFLVQLLVFLALLGLLSLPRLRMALVPRSLKRKRAHRAAAEQFLLRGLTRKKARTGVMLFVSQAERYARVIADEGVASKVDAARWSEAIGLLVTHAGEDRVADGFVAAVGLCGRVLAEQFPPTAEPANELSDRFFLI